VPVRELGVPIKMALQRALDEISILSFSALMAVGREPQRYARARPPPRWPTSPALWAQWVKMAASSPLV
jgi:hypothetical protein